MIEPIIIAALAAGFYVALNMGSNDAANTMAPAVGGRIISFSGGICLLAIFLTLGAVLEGGKVMHTVGEGILTGPAGSNPLTQVPEAAIAALVSAGLLVMLVTILKLPVSTPQAIVGAVVGAGLAIPLISGVQAQVQLGELLMIIIGWVVVPFAAALLAFALFTALKRGLRRVKNLMTLNRVLSILVVVACALTAYSQGANDVGAAMGVLSSLVGGDYSVHLIGLFGAAGMLIGAILSRGRVLTTMGAGITRLDPQMAFAAQVGAALSVWVCIQFGIPASITQALVGGIVGVGLTGGIAAVNRRKLRQMGTVWILIPPLACLLSMLLSALALLI